MPATKTKPAPKATGNGHSLDISGTRFDAALKASGEFQLLKAHVASIDLTMTDGFSSLEGRFDKLDANPMVKLGTGLTGMKRVVTATIGVLVVLGSVAYALEHVRDLIKTLGF